MYARNDVFRLFRRIAIAAHWYGSGASSDCILLFRELYSCAMTFNAMVSSSARQKWKIAQMLLADDRKGSINQNKW